MNPAETPREIDDRSAALSLIEALERSGLCRGEDALSAAAALSIGIRTVELFAIRRIRAVLPRFPDTIRGLFAPAGTAEPSLRDAFVTDESRLGFLDLLDLLSDTTLSTISPRLYRGWHDKTQARREARRATAEAVGFRLDSGQRDSLLTALAVYNRVFLVPPPLELTSEEAGAALATVLQLLSQLAADEATATRIGSLLH